MLLNQETKPSEEDFVGCGCSALTNIYIERSDIGLAVRVLANGSGDLGSILGRVIPKTQKWYLIPPCLTLSIIWYGSRVKWSNLRKGVAPPTPLCSSYIYIYIYIYICIYIYIYIRCFQNVLKITICDKFPLSQKIFVWNSSRENGYFSQEIKKICAYVRNGQMN